MRNTENKIIKDNWEYLEIDISTPAHPNAVMLIDQIDWDYLKKLEHCGRIRANTFHTGGSTYPIVKRRGRNQSVLYILFRSPGAIKCISDNLCDIRRDNLIDGHELKHPGEEGFRVRKKHRRAVKRKPLEERNTILKTDGAVLTVDISTSAYQGQTLLILKKDWDKLKEMDISRITRRRFAIHGTKTIPIVDVYGDGTSRPKALSVLLYGPDARMIDYDDPKVSSLLPSNIRKEVTKNV